MEHITLTVAIVFSVLAVTLRPSYALAAYFTALLWYPNYLRVYIGTIDITVGRIVVVALLLRCLCDGRIQSRFKWSRLDTWVALSMAIYIGVFLITQPWSSAVENRAGFLMDTWFAYLVVRFCITDRTGLVTVVKWLAAALFPLAILGVIECTTGWRAFALLCRDFRGFMYLTSYPARWGYFRATGPFSHPILFGCGFGMFLPLVYYLRRENDNWRVWGYVISCAVVCGALSSMSSGPWVTVIMVIFCLAMEKQKRWVKPVLVFFVFSFIVVEVVSNRPFYHVIASYANLVGGAGWHRAKLIDLAIRDFAEWWLLGYGGKQTGWGHYLGMSRTDITNEFIVAGVRYGILGIIVLCGVLTTAFSSLLRSYKKTADPELKSLYWSLGSVLFSVTVTWMSVSFFGQLMSIFYCLLGVIGSSFGFVQNGKSTMIRLLRTNDPNWNCVSA